MKRFSFYSITIVSIVSVRLFCTINGVDIKNLISLITCLYLDMNKISFVNVTTKTERIFIVCYSILSPIGTVLSCLQKSD